MYFSLIKCMYKKILKMGGDPGIWMRRHKGPHWGRQLSDGVAPPSTLGSDVTLHLVGVFIEV